MKVSNFNSKLSVNKSIVSKFDGGNNPEMTGSLSFAKMTGSLSFGKMTGSLSF